MSIGRECRAKTGRLHLSTEILCGSNNKEVDKILGGKRGKKFDFVVWFLSSRLTGALRRQNNFFPFLMSAMLF